MKRLIYLCSAVVLVTSFGLAGGRSYAAHSHIAMMPVRLCGSMPLGVPSNHAQSQGVFNASTLASEQWKARFKKIGLNLLHPLNMDDAKSDGSLYSTDRERSNALNCVGRSDTFGYDGALNSGASLVSEPVLNRAGLAQISPANSGTVLTDPRQRAAQEPATASHRLPTVSYFRTVTTDALQGPADAVVINKSLHGSKYYLIDDKLTYGAGLAASMDAYAKSKLHMTRVGVGHVDSTDASTEASSGAAIADRVASTNPDAVFCGCDSETVISLVKDLRSRGYTKPAVGGDAWVTQDMIDKVGTTAMRSVYATAFGPGPKASARFIRLYRNRFHIQLSTYDATSYDAANIMLNCIYKAAKAGKLKTGTMFKKRAAVTSCVAHVKWYGSIGVTSFDRNGDTTNRIISVYAVKGGRWAVEGFAPPVTGINPTG